MNAFTSHVFLYVQCIAGFTLLYRILKHEGIGALRQLLLIITGGIAFLLPLPWAREQKELSAAWIVHIIPLFVLVAIHCALSVRLYRKSDTTGPHP